MSVCSAPGCRLSVPGHCSGMSSTVAGACCHCRLRDGQAPTSHLSGGGHFTDAAHSPFPRGLGRAGATPAYGEWQRPAHSWHHFSPRGIGLWKLDKKAGQFEWPANPTTGPAPRAAEKAGLIFFRISLSLTKLLLREKWRRELHRRNEIWKMKMRNETVAQKELRKTPFPSLPPHEGLGP